MYSNGGFTILSGRKSPLIHVYFRDSKCLNAEDHATHRKLLTTVSVPSHFGNQSRILEIKSRILQKSHLRNQKSTQTVV